MSWTPEAHACAKRRLFDGLRWTDGFAWHCCACGEARLGEACWIDQAPVSFVICSAAADAPLDLDVARDLRDQCRKAGVPFWFDAPECELRFGDSWRGLPEGVR